MHGEEGEREGERERGSSARLFTHAFNAPPSPPSISITLPSWIQGSHSDIMVLHVSGPLKCARALWISQ